MKTLLLSFLALSLPLAARAETLPTPVVVSLAAKSTQKAMKDAIAYSIQKGLEAGAVITGYAVKSGDALTEVTIAVGAPTLMWPTKVVPTGVVRAILSADPDGVEGYDTREAQFVKDAAFTGTNFPATVISALAATGTGTAWKEARDYIQGAEPVLLGYSVTGDDSRTTVLLGLGYLQPRRPGRIAGLGSIEAKLHFFPDGIENYSADGIRFVPGDR